MKRVHRTRYGGPEVLEIREVEPPRPGPGEVLVRVRATTVNRTDCAILRASPFVMRFFTGLLAPRRHATGTDFAGDVASVGDGVMGFSPGDRVWGFDDGGCGSHADYLVFPARKAILQAPASLPYESIVACAEGAHYARNFVDKVPIEAGHRVLVNGATGAIGSAAVQLLAHRGVRVTAVCPAAHVDRVRDLGAERVIPFDEEDFTQGSDRYHFVFDAVGKSTFGRCKRILEPGGAYLSSELGPGAENLYLSLVTPLRRGAHKVIFPVPSDIRGSLSLVGELAVKGAFRPLIDRAFPLDHVRDAFAYVESGQKVGNVILQP